VANEIAVQKVRYESMVEQAGLNPYALERNQKETRLHLLKSRSKRNTE